MLKPVTGWACALTFVASIALTACGQASNQSSGGETIQVDGSSTVFPLSEAAAEAFSTETQGRVRVTVGESGTGGGFRKFCRGETDVQGASRPISTEELEACAAANITFVEALVAFDGLTVVVHPSNPIEEVTLEQLRTIWEPAAERSVMNWRQVNSSWPDLGLQLFGPGTASGTFDFFTEAVVGTAKSSRTDYTPSEDDNVIVQGVVNNPGAMGYFGIAYYEQNRERLKALAIRVDGRTVLPSAESVANGEYPLARPLFVYVNAEALQRPTVSQFMQYYIENAARLAPSVGYVPLPENAYATYVERVRSRAVGTAFGGRQQVGASMADVISRPLSSSVGTE
jgi:phosphate transport system substrate-binding protein